MSQSGFSGALAAGIAADVQPLTASRRKPGKRAHRQELELKLAALQKDYADLHAGLFEAAQVYRRLCAPRMIRHGDFEIASETFAARHLPGDFVTVEECFTTAAPGILPRFCCTKTGSLNRYPKEDRFSASFPKLPSLPEAWNFAWGTYCWSTRTGSSRHVITRIRNSASTISRRSCDVREAAPPMRCCFQ
jgi:hypothetical protein